MVLAADVGEGAERGRRAARAPGEDGMTVHELCSRIHEANRLHQRISLIGTAIRGFAARIRGRRTLNDSPPV